MNLKSFQFGKLAQRFYVAKSFVQKLLKQYQQTGDIKPKRQGGNVPPKLQGDALVNFDRNS